MPFTTDKPQDYIHLLLLFMTTTNIVLLT